LTKHVFRDKGQHAAADESWEREKGKRGWRGGLWELKRERERERTERDRERERERAEREGEREREERERERES
jgi:hypothetical protein